MMGLHTLGFLKSLLCGCMCVRLCARPQAISDYSSEVRPE